MDYSHWITSLVDSENAYMSYITYNSSEFIRTYNRAVRANMLKSRICVLRSPSEDRSQDIRFNFLEIN